jgi:hypothetical protein
LSTIYTFPKDLVRKCQEILDQRENENPRIVCTSELESPPTEELKIEIDVDGVEEGDVEMGNMDDEDLQTEAATEGELPNHQSDVLVQDEEPSVEENGSIQVTEETTLEEQQPEDQPEHQGEDETEHQGRSFSEVNQNEENMLADSAENSSEDQITPEVEEQASTREDSESREEWKQTIHRAITPLTSSLVEKTEGMSFDQLMSLFYRVQQIIHRLKNQAHLQFGDIEKLQSLMDQVSEEISLL